MERDNFDVDEIPVIMDIRPYMFEHKVLNNIEENTSRSREESNPRPTDIEFLFLWVKN